MHHDLVDFIPEILTGLTPEYNATHPISKRKHKNYIIISVDIEKILKKILHHFLMELLNKLRTAGNIFSVIQDVYKKNCIVNFVKLDTFPPRSGTKQRSPYLFTTSFQHCTEGPRQTN